MMVSAENDPRRTGTIWMLNLGEDVPVVKPRVSATFRRVEADLLPALTSAVGDNAAAGLLKRFETGRRCYAAWVEDRVAAYAWVSLNEEHIGELNLRIKLLPGEVYIWDCATVPELRRNHLYSALLSYMVVELRTEGFGRAWIGADVENIPSQQGIARAGFQHVADLIVARVVAMRQVWAQGQPGVSESVVAEARRVFLNDRDKVWRAISSSTIQS